MGSLLTGEYPTIHGAVGRADRLRSDIPTLASQLQTAGYRTAAIVANPNIGPAFGFERGFDEFIEMYSHVAAPRPILPSELIATAERMVDRTLEWIRQRPQKPFFLLVFSVDPHTPYTPPAPYDRLYDPTYTGNIDGSLRGMYGLGVFGPRPPDREISHLRALYDGEVAYSDDQFSRLREVIDSSSLNRNTITILTSDHGEEFYEHGSRDHGHTLYNELLHVPLIFYGPGYFSSRTVNVPVQSADLYKTILALAGKSAGEGPGRDLTPYLRGTLDAGTEIFAELSLDKHQVDALILDTDKVIRSRFDGSLLHFDLAADPGELASLPDAGPLSRKIQDLREALDRAGASSPKASRVRRDALPEAARQALEQLGYGDVTQPESP